jgi:hypothetical protein
MDESADLGTADGAGAAGAEYYAVIWGGRLVMEGGRGDGEGY